MLNRCSPEEQAILRRILAHSEKTSREWYTRPNLTTTGVQAVNIIQRLLDPQEKACFEGKTAKGFPHEKPPLPAECAIPAICDRSVQSKASSSVIVPPSDASGPTCLTAMQREELEELFSDEIDRGKTVTMQEVRKRMIGVTILSPLCITTARLKQATNFVNYLARKMSNTTAPDSDADVRVRKSVRVAG